MSPHAYLAFLRLTVDIASWKWFLFIFFFFYVFVQTSNLCECYVCFKPDWLEFNWKAGVSLAKKKKKTYLHTYTLHIVNFVKPCINSVLFEYQNCSFTILQKFVNSFTVFFFLSSFPTSLKVKYTIQQHAHKEINNKCEANLFCLRGEWPNVGISEF